MVPTPTGEMAPANAMTPEGHLLWLPPAQLAAIPLQVPPVPVPSTPGYGPPQHGSPYGAPVGVPGATAPHVQSNGHHQGFDGAADEREAPPHAQGPPYGAGEAVSVGPGILQSLNGSGASTDEREALHASGGGGGFNAINH